MNISFVVAKNYESGDGVFKQPIVAIFATNGCQRRFRAHLLFTFKMTRKTSAGFLSQRNGLFGETNYISNFFFQIFTVKRQSFII